MMARDQKLSRRQRRNARAFQASLTVKVVDPAMQSRRDKMIADGSLIIADLTKQAPNNSYGPPIEYRDAEFTCIDCGSVECWTAKQQQWWYEVAKGSVNSRAIRCQECRHIDRLVKRAAQWPIAKKPVAVLMDTDDSRIRRMKQVLSELVPELAFVTRLTSSDLYQSFSHVLPGTRFLSLGSYWLSDQTHKSSKSCKFLDCFVCRTPRCPVLIHGTPTASSLEAVESLRLAHWKVAEVDSSSIDWIESVWRDAVSSSLKLKRAR